LLVVPQWLIVFHLPRAFDATLLALLTEDLDKDLWREIVDLDFVLDPPNKGFLGELIELQVSGEDNHNLKWNRESHSGTEGERVNPSVERDDPTIQQLARLDVLAPEVVNDQNAVIGLHRQGRETNTGHVIDSRRISARNSPPMVKSRRWQRTQRAAAGSNAKWRGRRN
jgi:hypothetical protein